MKNSIRLMNGIITLENIPDEYVRLKEDLLYEMVDEALKLVRLGQLCKLSMVSEGKILKFHCRKDRRKSILVSDLEKLSNFLVANGKLQYSLENIQKKIVGIGRHNGIVEPNFPIDFTTSEGGAIIADVLTDGFISSKFCAGYTNIDSMQIIENLKTMNKLFANHQMLVTKSELKNLSNKNLTLEILRSVAKRSKIKCKIYKVKEKPNPGYSIRYHACVGKIINILSVPKGDKLKSNPHVPKFLFNAKRGTIFKFIERVLINEGHIRKLNIKLGHSVDVTSYLPYEIIGKFISNPRKYSRPIKAYLETLEEAVPNLIKDYVVLLSLVGCTTGRHYFREISVIGDEIHAACSFHITGNSLDIIRNNCDLNSSYKFNELKERENIKKRFPTKARLTQIIQIANKMKKLRSRDVAKELGITIGLTPQYLSKLVELKKLVRKEKGPLTYYELVH